MKSHTAKVRSLIPEFFGDGEAHSIQEFEQYAVTCFPEITHSHVASALYSAASNHRLRKPSRGMYILDGGSKIEELDKESEPYKTLLNIMYRVTKAFSLPLNLLELIKQEPQLTQRIMNLANESQALYEELKDCVKLERSAKSK